MKVEVDIDVDDLVRKELVCQALSMLEDDYDEFEALENKAEEFAAFCRVIRFYSDRSQWQDFLTQVGKGVVEDA